MPKNPDGTTPSSEVTYDNKSETARKAVGTSGQVPSEGALVEGQVQADGHEQDRAEETASHSKTGRRVPQVAKDEKLSTGQANTRGTVTEKTEGEPGPLARHDGPREDDDE